MGNTVTTLSNDFSYHHQSSFFLPSSALLTDCPHHHITPFVIESLYPSQWQWNPSSFGFYIVSSTLAPTSTINPRNNKSLWRNRLNVILHSLCWIHRDDVQCNMVYPLMTTYCNGRIPLRGLLNGPTIHIILTDEFKPRPFHMCQSMPTIIEILTGCDICQF